MSAERLGLIGVGDGLTGGRSHGLVAGVRDLGHGHGLIGGLSRPGGPHHLLRCSGGLLNEPVRGCIDSGLRNRLGRGAGCGGRVARPAGGGGRARLRCRGNGRPDGGGGGHAGHGAVLDGALSRRRLVARLLSVLGRLGRGLDRGPDDGLRIHESLVDGEGLDEKGLTRRRGDRLGLDPLNAALPDRCSRLL